MMPIQIRVAQNESERSEARSFIEHVAFESHGCSPPPPSAVVFAAWREEHVVGTIALDFADRNTSFPLESMYAIERGKTPLPFEREKIAQYGKWMAKTPGISSALIYVATLHALRVGKIYGCGEIKRPIFLRLRSFGMDIRIIEKASLMLVNIPLERKRYYTEPPIPTPFMMELVQVRDALWKKVRPAFDEGRITYE